MATNTRNKKSFHKLEGDRKKKLATDEFFKAEFQGSGF